jgi:hypothetical protein
MPRSQPWPGGGVTAADGGHNRRFLNIDGAHAAGRINRIGLDVPVIDHPTLLKTLIMVRGYKRLRPGRHDFGPAVPTD